MTNFSTLLETLHEKLAYTEGHSIAIYSGLDLELSSGYGFARVNPNVKMSSLIRMDVLSMSKTITAAGIVRQLLANGLTPHARIGPYLPAYWTVNPVVYSLTFAHVLTHTGGLRGDKADFGQLQTLVASAPAGPIGVGKYQNINYSLMRVLLAYLDSGAQLNPFGSFVPNRPILSQFTALVYLANIQNNVLKPCGITTASIGPESPASDQAEWFNDSIGDLGDQHNPANTLLVCGADHWNMNTREYGRFITHLVNGFIDPNPWPTMRDTRPPEALNSPPSYPEGDGRLGVWRFQAPTGAKVPETANFYGHNGDWSDAFTGWMTAEDGTTVVFFANSKLGAEEQEKMILDSWLAA